MFLLEYDDRYVKSGDSLIENNVEALTYNERALANTGPEIGSKRYIAMMGSCTKRFRSCFCCCQS